MRTLALTLALLFWTSSASADILFASGPLFSTLTSAMTVCQITNLGSRPVKFVNAAIIDVAAQGLQGPTADTCTTAPLLFGETCAFSATPSGGAGGGQIFVKGSTRSLRGTCRLQNPATSAPLVFDPMR
jgi:hypothetical protein